MKKLSDPDLDLRLASSVGMEQGIKQVIVRQCGFELYNTRPYHNYETWSDGYLVIGRRDGKAMTKEEASGVLLSSYRNSDEYLVVSREDMDEAVRAFALALQPELDARRENVKRRR
jgi:hypothetical protein